MQLLCSTPKFAYPSLTLVACALAVCSLPDTARSDQAEISSSTSKADDELYPLGLALRTLQQDLNNTDYREVLETMIPTDLAAEWQRVGTADNFQAFAEQHGGMAKLAQDPVLLEAYNRRKAIADQYLELMREAYNRKKITPPFDDAARLSEVLQKVAQLGNERDASTTPMRMLMPAPNAERHWPAFRGPTGQGMVFESEIPQQWSDSRNVAWQSPLPGRGNSSPILWENRLFVTAEGAPRETDAPLAQADAAPDRLLLCYSAETGKQLWQHAAPKPTQHEVLYWKNTLASSTPVTDGERVIAFFGNAGLLCCDLAGNRLWHTDLGTFPIMHGPGSTPVLYHNLVIVVQDQNEGESLCAAFDKTTGERVWHTPRPNSMGWSSPVIMRIGDRDELIYNGSNAVVAYDPATGKELWSIAGTSIESIPMIVSGGGLFYSASGRNGPIFAFRPGGTGDITSSHGVWRLERGGPHVPTPLYHNDRLFIVSDTGVLTCLDAKSGEMLSQKRLRGRFSASPFVVADRLYLLNEEGITYICQGDESLTLLGQNELHDVTYATPAVLGRRLYFRTANKLICIGEVATSTTDGS